MLLLFLSDPGCKCTVLSALVGRSCFKICWLIHHKWELTKDEIDLKAEQREEKESLLLVFFISVKFFQATWAGWGSAWTTEWVWTAWTKLEAQPCTGPATVAIKVLNSLVIWFRALQHLLHLREPAFFSDKKQCSKGCVLGKGRAVVVGVAGEPHCETPWTAGNFAFSLAFEGTRTYQ